MLSECAPGPTLVLDAGDMAPLMGCTSEWKETVKQGTCWVMVTGAVEKIQSPEDGRAEPGDVEAGFGKPLVVLLEPWRAARGDGNRWGVGERPGRGDGQGQR